MKRILAAVAMLAASVFAQAPTGFTVSIERTLHTGAIILFTTDDATVQGYEVEIHYTLNGRQEELRTYCMSRFGGNGSTIVNIGDYTWISAQAWEVKQIGRSAFTTN